MSYPKENKIEPWEPPCEFCGKRSEPIKTGTFLCWLWGHKFMFREYTQWIDEDGRKNEKGTVIPTDYCIRCGINREGDNSKNV